MKKGFIMASFKDGENVDVDLNWKDEKEMFFLTTSLFSTIIKTIGRKKAVQLFEEGDKLKDKETLNEIDKMLDEGIPVEEIAEKYGEDVCVQEYGMEAPSYCNENADCNGCWVECLNKRL